MITTALLLCAALCPALPQEGSDPANPGLADARPAPAKGVEVTYLGGEGFLVRSRAKVLLLDAFLVPDDGLPAIPDEVMQALVQREGIFGKVHVLVGTHLHGDRYRAKEAAGFLRGQKGEKATTTFAEGPPDVVGPLVEALEGAPEVVHVNERWKKVGKSNMLTLLGLRLDYLNVPHAGDEGAKIQHLVVSTSHAGLRVVYFGHAEPKLEHLEPYQERIANADVAIVPYPWLLDAGSRSLLLNRVAPRHVIVTGVPEKERADLAPRLEKAFPGVVVPAKPLESHTFTPTPREKVK